MTGLICIYTYKMERYTKNKHRTIHKYFFNRKQKKSYILILMALSLWYWLQYQYHVQVPLTITLHRFLETEDF